MTEEEREGRMMKMPSEEGERGNEKEKEREIEREKARGSGALT